MKVKLFLTILVILVAGLLQGCYLNAQVEPNEMGIRLSGGRILNVVGPGLYSDFWGFFADIETVGVGTVTFSVEDPEVLTSDNQPVGVRITIQARRNSSTDAITNLRKNWPALIKDESLVNTITATAREGIKVGTRDFTLTGLLNDRNDLAKQIQTAIEGDAEKYSVEIINVTIENIAPSAEFVALLQKKANYVAETDAELQRQALIRQQKSNDRLEQEQRIQVEQQRLLAEEAKTKVEVEIAKRDGELVKQRSQVYALNPQAFELERLARLKDVLGNKASFYFLPEGTDLTMLWTPSGAQVVPVAQP